MRAVIFLFVSLCVAGAVPLLKRSPRIVPDKALLRVATFEDVELRRLPLTKKESLFYERFPGRVGKFTDGKRTIIIRELTHPTRKLHPAGDCFRGMGYAITPLSLHVDSSGASWNRFRAVKGRECMYVRELIRDVSGHTYPDVSTWYWAATLGKSQGPWLNYVVVEK